MTIQEAVTKATEGGYHINGADGMDTAYVGANSDYSVWTRKDNASSFVVVVYLSAADNCLAPKTG
jgi:hypothetical protein